MWLFIWLALAPNGTLTSGSIEFPTQEACNESKKAWAGRAFDLTLEEKLRVRIDAQCVQRATGKPAG